MSNSSSKRSMYQLPPCCVKAKRGSRMTATRRPAATPAGVGRQDVRRLVVQPLTWDLVPPFGSLLVEIAARAPDECDQLLRWHLKAMLGKKLTDAFLMDGLAVDEHTVHITNHSLDGHGSPSVCVPGITTLQFDITGNSALCKPYATLCAKGWQMSPTVPNRPLFTLFVLRILGSETRCPDGT